MPAIKLNTEPYSPLFKPKERCCIVVGDIFFFLFSQECQTVQKP